MRTFAAKFLPYSSEDVLDDIPLSGLNSGRPEKFFLGKLAKYRGNTIDQVLEQSVIDSLQRSNFNSLEDIVQLFNKLGVDVKEIRHLFPKIKDLMERRHLIVHRADRLDGINSQENIIQEIDSQEVIAWAENILELFTILANNLAEKLIKRHYES